MLLRRILHRFSEGNRQLLDKLCHQQLKIKPIELLSGQVEIIKDPIDFYITLHNSMASASRRIALSSLYIGTGALERFLLHRLTDKLQNQHMLRARLLFDFYRSQRNEQGDSSLELVQNVHRALKPQTRDNLRVGYLKSRKPRAFDLLSGSLAEVLGVHHIKLYVFDNDVIVTGANLSHSYFTYRQDRYMMIRGSEELSGRMYDLVDALVDGSTRFNEDALLEKDPYDNLENYVKMWRFSNRPQQDYKPSEPIHTEAPKTQPTQQRQVKQETALIKRQQQAKENLRQALSKTLDSDNVALILSKLRRKEESKDVTPSGQKIYIYPVTQLNLVNDNSDRRVLTDLLKSNINLGSTINISSGYMNFPQFLVQLLTTSKQPINVLTSAPEANSFFEGGLFKKYIPYFYRVYEKSLLETASNGSIRVKQYKRWGWTYHTKGIWITEPNRKSMVSVIGSSNFNMRSYERDTECQLYIYSECGSFNGRMEKQWQNLDKDCKEVSAQQLGSDPQMKLGWMVRWLAHIFRRFM